MKKKLNRAKFLRILILSLLLAFPVTIYATGTSVEFTIDLADCIYCNVCPEKSEEINLGPFGAYFIHGTIPTSTSDKSKLTVVNDDIKNGLFEAADACPVGAITYKSL